MRKHFLAAPMLVLLAAGCGSDSGSGPTGRLSLAVTDAPVDRASEIVIQFTGVELQPAGAPSRIITFPAPLSIDLLSLAAGDSATLLDNAEVPAGRYDGLRLLVQAHDDGIFDSFIVLNDGERAELVIPAEAEAGLRLMSGFRVPSGDAASFTVDFDLRRSVHEPSDGTGPFLLRPALRLLDNARIGAVAGTVDQALMPSGCAPAVYAYEGGGATPDDVGSPGANPLTSAVVDRETGSYSLDFLSPGIYTVAFTCQAAADDPSRDDAVTFSGARDVEVLVDATTTADFQPPA